MKSVAGIIRRMLFVVLLIASSTVLCCGINNSFSAGKTVINNEDSKSVKKLSDEIMPNQLVSIRIMQLL